MKSEKCHPDSIASRFTLHASRSSLPLGEDGRGLLIYHSSIPSFIQRIADTPAMQRLKEITDILEKNECDLDMSMKLYEEGNALIKDLQKSLDEAETKIQVIKDKQ